MKFKPKKKQLAPEVPTRPDTPPPWRAGLPPPRSPNLKKKVSGQASLVSFANNVEMRYPTPLSRAPATHEAVPPWQCRTPSGHTAGGCSWEKMAHRTVAGENYVGRAMCAAVVHELTFRVSKFPPALRPFFSIVAPSGPVVYPRILILRQAVVATAIHTQALIQTPSTHPPHQPGRPNAPVIFHGGGHHRVMAQRGPVAHMGVAPVCPGKTARAHECWRTRGGGVGCN